MNQKSNILLATFIIIILASIFLTYKRAFVDKNFEIISPTDDSSQ